MFFGDDKILDLRWVTFTVTTTGKEFLDEIINLTGSGTGSGGLLTLKDLPWVISLSIFEQPEILDQPPGTYVWWGYGLHPEKKGDLSQKPMNECTGREILWEILHHLKMEKGNPKADTIVSSSICIPSDMPYVNNIWLKRKRGDRPPVVPEGMTNLGLLGQYVELEREITFTFDIPRARPSKPFACSRVVTRRRPSIAANTIRRACGRLRKCFWVDEDLGEDREARAPSHLRARGPCRPLCARGRHLRHSDGWRSHRRYDGGQVRSSRSVDCHRLRQWTNATQRQGFYHLSQGSEIMPWIVLTAVDVADPGSVKPFVENFGLRTPA